MDFIIYLATIDLGSRNPKVGIWLAPEVKKVNFDLVAV